MTKKNETAKKNDTAEKSEEMRRADTANGENPDADADEQPDVQSST